MNLDFEHLLPQDFASESRVWIYQSSRLLSISEALGVEDALVTFCNSWRSHGNSVKAHGNLFFGQFIVLLADETGAGVSGCSTDSSVQFVKTLGEKLGVDFFNRTTLAFLVKDKIQVLPLSQLSYAFENGFIDAETKYFNNLVGTREDLINNWIIPVRSSWLASKLPPAATNASV
ncbi:MAG: hypothetical protein WKF70_02565 [Chitinophagaceae bacterium]